MSQTETPSETLRKIIRGCPISPSELGRLSDTSPGVITRFVKGEREITTATFDRLCQAMNLKLVQAGPLPTQQPRSRRRRMDQDG